MSHKYYSSSFPRPWYLGLPTLVNQGWTLVYQHWLTNVEPWLTNIGFFHFLPHFCHIWWFFNRNCIFYHFWYYPLWKIIKYGKNLGENEKNQRWLTKVQHWLTNVGKSWPTLVNQRWFTNVPRARERTTGGPRTVYTLGPNFFQNYTVWNL